VRVCRDDAEMTPFRIALANLPFPQSPAHAIELCVEAVAEAGRAGAELVCFPEAFVPGYRREGHRLGPPDAAYLERAASTVAAAAARSQVAVVLGSERIEADALLLTALVFDRDGRRLGAQDKVQLDPSEEAIYRAGSERRTFKVGRLTFGVAICHEAFRYPETVRWAAVRGAQLVVHPQFYVAEPGGYVPSRYADPANTFHEKSALCRAAENTCWFATVNFASPGSPTTSAVVRPDGTLLCYQPYGEAGLLLADLDLDAATGLLASRLRTV
jgi:predicted amidohydrolase